MSKIKVIVKRPDEEFGHMTRISNTLENLQKTVGGYIETVTICTNTVVICNEEGLLRQLPYNCAVLNEEIFVEFLGTIIVAGVTGDGFSDIGLTMKEWKEMIQ